MPELPGGTEGAKFFFSLHNANNKNFRVGKFSPVAVQEFGYPTMVGSAKRDRDEDFDADTYVSVRNGLSEVSAVLMHAIDNKLCPPVKNERDSDKKKREKNLQTYLQTKEMSLNTFMDYWAQYLEAKGMLTNTGIPEQPGMLLPEVPDHIMTRSCKKQRTSDDAVTVSTADSSYNPMDFMSQLTGDN